MFRVLKSGMRLRVLVILSLIALCVSCRQQGGGVLSPETGPSTPFSLPHSVTSSEGGDGGGSQGEGTGSGGGSFGDTYAKETLSIAKGALSRMILAASPELFVKLPADRGQEWLAELVSRVELRKEVSPSRYGNPLKFDYDLKTKTIFATNFFVNTFPYGRFWTRPLVEQHRILLEVMTDILHEAAHFYDIGITEKSDPNAEAWAMILMDYLSQDNISCKSESLGRAGFSIIYLHRPSGIFFLRSIDQLSEDSKNYVDWRNKTDSNPFRYLTSPELFLNQGVELEKWEKERREGWLENPAQPIQILADLAQVKIETVFDKPKEPDVFVFTMASPDSMAYIMGERSPQIRWGSGAFGIPVVNQTKITYSREDMYMNQVLSTNGSLLIEDIPTQEYDRFILDRKNLTATYTYGIKANGSKLSAKAHKAKDSPVSSETYRYQCERISRKQIAVKNFISDEAIPAEKIIPAEIEASDEGLTPFISLESKKRDFADFLAGAHDVMNNNAEDSQVGDRKEIKLWGTSDAGIECVISFFASPESAMEKTVIFTVSEFGGESGRRSFLQTNFVIEDSHAYSIQSGVSYALKEATASPSQLKIWQSQGSGAGHANFEQAGSFFEKTDSEMTIDIDPQTGKILSATAVDHANGIKTLTCIARPPEQ